METPQAPVVPAANPEGAPPVQPATEVVPQQYAPEPATAPASAPAQAPVESAEETRAKGFQRLADERQLQIYQLQQELERKNQAPAPQPTGNPYDPQTQWTQWMGFELNKTAEAAAEKASERILGTLTNAAQAQYETQWQSAHPEVDIRTVKAFQASRGIRQIDDAYRLMTMDNSLLQARNDGGQQAINQFRQPQQVQGAVSVRGAQSTGGPAQLIFEKMALDFQNSNGAVYNTWSPALQKAFDAEWGLRESSRANGRH